MSIQPAVPITPSPQLESSEASQLQRAEQGQRAELRDVFNQFVGETFYGQMLKAMRQTVREPAYFHGGRAEEVFQSQLDQVLAEKMSETSAATFTDPMFELFHLPRAG